MRKNYIINSIGTIGLSLSYLLGGCSQNNAIDRCGPYVFAEEPPAQQSQVYSLSFRPENKYRSNLRGSSRTNVFDHSQDLKDFEIAPNSSNEQVMANAFDREGEKMLYVVDRVKQKDCDEITIMCYKFGGSFDNNNDGKSDFSDVKEVEKTEVSAGKGTVYFDPKKLKGERREEEFERFNVIAKRIGWK